MADGFELDPRLEATSLAVGETGLCLVRMADDSRYPWLLLVPRRPGMVELFDLASADRHRLVDLAADIAARMASAFAAEKMNVGALGNRVRQFHLHIIVRRTGDAAWPDAVWNGTPSIPYRGDARDAALGRMRACLPP